MSRTCSIRSELLTIGLKSVHVRSSSFRRTGINTTVFAPCKVALKPRDHTVDRAHSNAARESAHWTSLLGSTPPSSSACSSNNLSRQAASFSMASR